MQASLLKELLRSGRVWRLTDMHHFGNVVIEMTTLGSVEAKSHFSEMIDRASKGEEFVITKRGIPVVRVVSIDNGTSLEKRKALLAKLRVFREGKKTIRKAGQSWSEVAHTDHKW